MSGLRAKPQFRFGKQERDLRFDSHCNLFVFFFNETLEDLRYYVCFVFPGFHKLVLDRRSSKQVQSLCLIQGNRVQIKLLARLWLLKRFYLKPKSQKASRS